MPNINDKTEISIEASHIGGEIALNNQDSISKETKSSGSIVTDSDREAELKIRDYISNNSEIKIYGEEFGGEVDDKTYWIIDPIDGTRNYSRGNPIYCTSVCLVKDNRPVSCSVYFPKMDMKFYSEYNNGSYLNDERIYVSGLNDTDEDVFVAAGFKSVETHQILSNITGWTQRYHCSLYSACSIATGWTDAGVFTNLKPWDLASGYLLVNEAQGNVKNPISGENWNNNNNNTIMWNGEEAIYSRIIDEFDEFEINEYFK